MIQKISIALFVILICVLEYVNFKQNENFKIKLHDDYTEKRLLFQRQLESSERQRVALLHRFDSVNNLVESAVRTNLKLDSLLSKVKGSYKDRTPTELEKEMVKRFNESQ